MKDIKIVIGAGFGDEGKGKLTDYYTKDKDIWYLRKNGKS